MRIKGGGIAGLAAAWYLRKKHPVTIIEKTNRLGGYIRTVKEGPFTFELGPRTFRYGHSPHLLSLIRELNLPIIRSDPAANKRYIWYSGKLRSPLAFFPWKEPFVKKGENKDESIYEFAVRRKINPILLDIMTLGIYAGDFRTLSMKCCFPKLYEWEKKYGSLFKGFLKEPKKEKGLFSITGGMEKLINALTCDAIFNSTEEGDLDMTPPQGPKQSLWVVSLGYLGEVLKQKAFGYLVPTCENELVLGAVFDSCIFPQQNTQITVMLRPETINPIATALDALKRHIDLTAIPHVALETFAKDAIPQFPVGALPTFGVSVEAAVERAVNATSEIFTTH